MDIDLTRPLGSVLVLDLETQPDPAAVAIAGRGGQMERAALHRIVAFSLLTAREGTDGNWSDVELVSGQGEHEAPLLQRIDEHLTAMHEDRGTLVTWNGLAHDAGILRRRLMANWCFQLCGIAQLPEVPHLDLMRTGTRGWRHTWPSLSDACAGLGIPTDHLATARAGELAKAIRKSQVDVCATFLVLLHELALARSDASPLVAGWQALRGRIAKPDLRAPHLEQFGCSPFLSQVPP